MPNKRKLDSKRLKQLQERFWSLCKPVQRRQLIENLKVLPPLKRRPLSQVYPEIALDWLDELNCGYSPDDFNYGSSFMVWWFCPNGPDHVYCQKIGTHVRAYKEDSKMRGCPFCRGLLPSITNSLVSLYPELAEEWDEKRNKKTADLVVAHSNKKVWWKCKNDSSHLWQAKVGDRTAYSTGCPHCFYQITDLSDYPTAFKEFDKKKNKGVDPHNITMYEKLWWRCPKGKDHIWQSAFRRGRGMRCPFCRRRKASTTNNLTLDEYLCSQFHPKKNGKLKPEDVALGTNQKIWWKCPLGPDHEWQAQVYEHEAQGKGCPYCRGLKVSKANSLAALYPQIAREWHKTKNGRLKASDVTSKSAKRVWWCCSLNPNHEWNTLVHSRASSGSGCPLCLKEMRIRKKKQSKRFE